MKVLIACEESQRVCIEFRKRGHDAFSCDIQECSGGHPEWHILGDVKAIVNGRCSFVLQNGERKSIGGDRIGEVVKQNRTQFRSGGVHNEVD